MESKLPPLANAAVKNEHHAQPNLFYQQGLPSNGTLNTNRVPTSNDQYVQYQDTSVPSVPYQVITYEEERDQTAEFAFCLMLVGIFLLFLSILNACLHMRSKSKKARHYAYGSVLISIIQITWILYRKYS